MSTSNGQIANATTFNNAFVSKQTLNQNVDGTINLKNTSSGADVNNIQQTINDIKTVNSNQDSDITSIQSDLDGAINTSIGAVDANKLLRTDAEGFVSGSTQRYLGPSYADDTDANARYGGKTGGEVYYDFTLNIYKQWSVSAGAWVPLSRDEDLTAAIAVRASDADENKMVKTHDDGWLSKTLLKFPANSYADDTAAAAAYGTLVGGEFYYNTTDNAYKFYNGTSWTVISTGATITGIQSTTGISDANKFIKTNADGHLDKTFLATKQSFSSDANYVTALGRSAVLGDIYFNTTTGKSRIYNGTAWQDDGATSAPSGPTFQSFTATGAFTYNRPANVLYIKIQLLGAGGGGSGSSTKAANNGGNGGSGGNSTFGTATANGGVGATAGGGGGGAASLGGGGYIGFALSGANGSSRSDQDTANNVNSGHGGNSYFGGGGGAAVANNNGQGGNIGGGGGGAGATGISYTGAGGGAGGYAEFIINGPASTYSGSIGSSGAAGTAGTSGFSGGSGGDGLCFVWEYYQ